MQILMVATTVLYLLSTVGYVLFLFLQREVLHRAGTSVLAVGLAVHTLQLVAGTISAGHLPVQNLAETLSFAGWALAGVFLLVQWRYRIKVLGIYAAPLAALVMVFASQLPRTAAATDGSPFSSAWFVIHILTVFVGEAALALAGGTGVLYLIQERAIKTKKRGFFFRRLPSLDLLDTTGYACLVVGFTLLTVGLITGFVYAKAIWGRFWGWDPKEVWSGITWMLYAVLLHERLRVGWRGRRAAIMAIVGVGVLLFTFFGVNFLLKGHHGPFTQW
jgi:cytochrome c-type biogenesis protein CcsB